MKVEGKSRNAIWVHVNAAPPGTQVFHTRAGSSKMEALKCNQAMRGIYYFQLNNDPFVAGAPSKVFTIKIFEQGNCILT